MHLTTYPLQLAESDFQGTVNTRTIHDDQVFLDGLYSMFEWHWHLVGKGIFSPLFSTLNWLAGNDFTCHPIPPESELYFASLLFRRTQACDSLFFIRTQWYNSKNLHIFLHLTYLICCAWLVCFAFIILFLCLGGSVGLCLSWTEGLRPGRRTVARWGHIKPFCSRANLRSVLQKTSGGDRDLLNLNPDQRLLLLSGSRHSDL